MLGRAQRYRFCRWHLDGDRGACPEYALALVSREVIADSIETVMGAEGFDALVAIGGCDKNMPGCVMAIARLNRPAVFVYGGTIQPGAKERDIVSVFEAVGKHAKGERSATKIWKAVERCAIPGRAPAAACTPPTPWRRPSKRWACRCLTARRRKRSAARSSTTAAAPARPSEPDRAGITPLGHPDPPRRSRTPSPW